MKKKLILCTSILLGTIVLATASVVMNFGSSFVGRVSANTPANLTIDGDDVFTDGVAIVKTTNGNDVRIASTGSGLTLASGKALSNTDMIQGLTSMEVVLSSGAATVYGDYESGLPRNRAIGNVTTSSGTVYFSQGMRYFKIVATENAVINSISLNYSCPENIPFEMVDGILLDGIADDPIYTSGVKSNTLVLQNGQYRAGIISTKTSSGIITHVDYRVPSTITHATDWWKNDNFEIRFIDDTDGKYQIWASSINGGAHNFTKGYETSLTLVDGLYRMTYEEFESYADISNSLGYTVNSSSAIHFMAGTAWGAGWTPSNYWYARTAVGNARNGVGYFVTDNGIIDAQIEATIEAKVAQSSGTALLTAPFSVTATGWNLAGKNIAVDGSSNFSVVIDLDSVGSQTFPHSWAADISACNVDAGTITNRWIGGKGWSLRSDWWGWGSWNNGGIEQPCGWHDEGHSGGHGNLKDNMHVRLCVEKVNDLIHIYGKYVDNDIPANYTYIYYVSNSLNYSGPIDFNFGATGGTGDSVTVTYNSFTLISGSALATN